MHLTDAVIFGGWVCFWIYWLAAAGGVKQGRARWGRFAGLRIVIVVVVLILWRSRALGRPAVDGIAWLRGVGLVLFLAGLALAVWARVCLGENWGMPMTEKVDPELVTTGPYRHVRHPIYSGILLATLGTALAASISWLVLVVLVGAYFVYSAIREERYMLTRFPDSYPAYRASTKMLIPFIF